MIIIFFKSIHIKKEVKTKIDVIFNGKNAGKLIEDILKNTNVTLVPAPNSNQSEFIKGFNAYKTKDNKIKSTVNDLDLISANITDYVLLHKEEYELYLKFKRNNSHIVSLQIQNKIKADYKDFSQRALAKKYKLSLGTINNILNDNYL